MTRAEAKKLLIEIGISEPSDEQITGLINPVKAEIDTERAKSEKYKTDADKVADLEKELEILKTQGLSDVEKAMKQAEKIQKEAEDAKLDFTRKSTKVEVEKLLIGGGLKTEDYESFIDGIISDDLERSTALANKLVETIAKQKEGAASQKEQELMNKTKTPDGKGGSDGEEKSGAEKLALEISDSKSEVTKQSNEIVKNYV